MDIINSLMLFIISILDKLLPKLSLSNEFYSNVDNVLFLLINIIESVGYFIPLDIFVLCLTTMLIVDNFALFTRVGMLVIKLIRG